jgi:uncharacterized protein
MEVIFADAFYLIALVNIDDESHAEAVAWTRANQAVLLTTDAVLVEVADALAGTRHRIATEGFVRALRVASWVDVVPIDESLLDLGLKLYGKRPDKEWSLTDCMSFIVMRDRGVTQALTHDHHFKQAGFRVLL